MVTERHDVMCAGMKRERYIKWGQLSAVLWRPHRAYISVCTEYKGVDDDSRYRSANNKAKDHINGEAGCKGCSNSKHGLESNGQQQDETPAVPCTETEDVDKSLPEFTH